MPQLEPDDAGRLKVCDEPMGASNHLPAPGGEPTTRTRLALPSAFR